MGRQAERDNAAAWLPPGMAFTDAPVSGSSDDHPEHDSADRTDVDDGEAAEPDIAATDLPPFLTDDEPAGAALNGAAAS